MFQKTSFPDPWKGVIVWEWVKGSLPMFCIAPGAFIRRNMVSCNSEKNVLLTLYHTIPTFKPLPDNKILDWSKLKQIADDI